MIAEAKVEAYRVSARILAQLLRADMLSDWMQRDRCQFMLHRISLVKMRTEVGNRVHSMLNRHCLKCPYPPLFSQKAWSGLDGQIDVMGGKIVALAFND